MGHLPAGREEHPHAAPWAGDRYVGIPDSAAAVAANDRRRAS